MTKSGINHMLNHRATTKKRSLLKALTFRTFSVLVDYLILYSFIQKASTALWVTLVANAIRTLWYYWHERLWDHIEWGEKDKRK